MPRFLMLDAEDQASLSLAPITLLLLVTIVILSIQMDLALHFSWQLLSDSVLLAA